MIQVWIGTHDVAVYLTKDDEHSQNAPCILYCRCYSFIGLVYVLGILAIIVEVFVGLRHLPVVVFQTTQWTEFIRLPVFHFTTVLRRYALY